MKNFEIRNIKFSAKTKLEAENFFEELWELFGYNTPYITPKSEPELWGVK